jgi:hypothetical protein
VPARAVNAATRPGHASNAARIGSSSGGRNGRFAGRIASLSSAFGIPLSRGTCTTGGRSGIASIGRARSSNAPGATKTQRSSASETWAARVRTSSDEHSSRRTSRSAGVAGTWSGATVSTRKPRARSCMVSSTESSPDSVMIRASGLKPSKDGVKLQKGETEATAFACEPRNLDGARSRQGLPTVGSVYSNAIARGTTFLRGRRHVQSLALSLSVTLQDFGSTL